MSKDQIAIRCPSCGAKLSIAWPTPRARHARLKCPGCAADFPIAEAVERTVTGAPDDRDVHLVPAKPERPD